MVKYFPFNHLFRQNYPFQFKSFPNLNLNLCLNYKKKLKTNYILVEHLFAKKFSILIFFFSNLKLKITWNIITTKHNRKNWIEWYVMPVFPLIFIIKTPNRVTHVPTKVDASLPSHLYWCTTMYYRFDTLTKNKMASLML